MSDAAGKRQVRHIDVFYHEGRSNLADPQSYDDITVVGMIELLQDKLGKVPEEFRDKAYIEIQSYDDTPSFRIYYERPETEDEYQARRYDLEQRRQVEVEHEKAVLRALKAKYE